MKFSDVLPFVQPPWAGLIDNSWSSGYAYVWEAVAPFDIKGTVSVKLVKISNLSDLIGKNVVGFAFDEGCGQDVMKSIQRRIRSRIGVLK